MNFAVILAAGKGKRFGQLKQFAQIKNKPIVFYSIEKFDNSSAVDKIIIVTIKNKISYVKDLIKKYKFRKVTDVIAGGKERQDSVQNALKVLPNQGYVAIHDSARPLFSNKMIETGFNLVKKYQACIPTISIPDTIKEIKNKLVVKTLDRSLLHYVQTPQFFELGLLKSAYLKAAKQNYLATDDASLIERFGRKVHIFAGDKRNLKITDKQDFLLTQKLINLKTH